MPAALPNPSGDLFKLTPDLLADGYQASRESPRLRIILPVQRSQDAKVQRLLNFMQPGTYVRPHCHPEAHATESVCLISGELEVLIFSASGELLSRHQITPTTPLLDIEPGVWHSMIALQPDTAIFEVKQGPYDPSADKHFAPWAPQENEPDALKRLLAKL